MEDREAMAGAPAQPGATQAWPWRALSTIAMFNLLLLLWIVLRPGTSATFVTVDNVAQFVGPLLIVSQCVRAIRRRPDGAAPRRKFWVPLLVCLGPLCYALGQIIYTVYAQILHYATVPFPSWADAAYLSAYPVMLVGILLLPGRRLAASARARVFLDGLMIMTAVVTFSWYFILGPTIAQAMQTPVAAAVGLAYPLGDIVLIACLVILSVRIDEPALRRVIVMLWCALGVIVLTDTVYDYQNLHGGYSTGGVLDVGWPLGYMLVVVGAYMLRLVLAAQTQPAARPVAAPDPARPPRLWSSLLPVALVPFVGALLLYTRFAGHTDQYDPGVSIGAMVLVVVIISRQVLTILENRGLYSRLNAAYAAQGITLAQRERQMQTVVSNAPIVLCAINKAGICTLYEGQALALQGYAPGQFVGQSMFDRFSASPRALDAMRSALAGVASIHVETMDSLIFETSWTPLYDQEGAIEGAIAVSHDITQRTRAEEALQHQAFHDVLTGLPNRALFLDRLDHALARAHRHGARVGVLFLDLDRFKLVNDSLGHAAGDLLLVAVAERLKECIRDEDTVARFGGDEFAILAGELDDPNLILRMAERILQVLDAPFQLAGHNVVTSTSIGIVISVPSHAPADMLRDADVALYRAKGRGRGCFEVFDESMNAQALERLELEADLRAGLERAEFTVYYQPKVALATGLVEGMEALVRWHHPRRGLVSPAAFIPLAEETGLIRPLGQWVLEEACRQTKLWHDSIPDLTLVTSVNLSARQFQLATLVEDVAAALQMSGVNPAHIQLEITESAAMEDAEAAVNTLERLKALGIQLAIDDFGTGYSSLAYLKRFPVDELKIDRAFVSGLAENSEDASIVNAVASLGHALNLSIVAEGIETLEESAQVHALGCEIGQGYYFAKPLTAIEAETFLARRIPYAA